MAGEVGEGAYITTITLVTKRGPDKAVDLAALAIRVVQSLLETHLKKRAASSKIKSVCPFRVKSI